MKAEKTSSDFIREHPDDVGDRGRREGQGSGLPFRDTSLVGEVRRRALSECVPPENQEGGGKAGCSSKPVQSKAQFVRKFPSSTPAKEIVAKAKAAGMSIAVDHVYSVRSADKQAKRKSATKSNGLKPAEPVAPVVHGSASAPKVSVKAEMLLRAAAAEIGFGQCDRGSSERTCAGAGANQRVRLLGRFATHDTSSPRGSFCSSRPVMPCRPRVEPPRGRARRETPMEIRGAQRLSCLSGWTRPWSHRHRPTP